MSAGKGGAQGRVARGGRALVYQVFKGRGGGEGGREVGEEREGVPDEWRRRAPRAQKASRVEAEEIFGSNGLRRVGGYRKKSLGDLWRVSGQGQKAPPLFDSLRWTAGSRDPRPSV